MDNDTEIILKSFLICLVTPAVERVGGEHGEGDVEVPGDCELVPALLDQVDHLRVGEAEQQGHEESLE